MTAVEQRSNEDQIADPGTWPNTPQATPAGAARQVEHDGLELIARELGSAAKGSVIETSFDREQAALIVDPEQVLDVLSWLRDQPGQEYRFLAALHAAAGRFV